MGRVGVIGGLSWAATSEYYSLINRFVAERRGPTHSADLLLRSLDFAPILRLADDRSAVEGLLFDAAQDLIAGGARHLALASFTGHSYARRLHGLAIPFIDLPGSVLAALKTRGRQSVGILATGLSLGDAVLMDMLSDGGAVNILYPCPEHQRELDRIIFDELARGKCSPESIDILNIVADALVAAGAGAILLATTEFSRVRDVFAAQHNIIDSTLVHCQAIVDQSLNETDMII